jgi:hypothetical protein
MKKVITLVVDESIAKEIFEDYYELADFVSIETEDEAQIRTDGWSTWDGDEAGYDTCAHCGEIDCDCDARI